jgi:hypothetical protein
LELREVEVDGAEAEVGLRGEGREGSADGEVDGELVAVNAARSVFEELLALGGGGGVRESGWGVPARTA